MTFLSNLKHVLAFCIVLVLCTVINLSSLAKERNKSLQWAKTMEQAKLAEGLGGDPDKYTQRTFDYSELDGLGDAISQYEEGLYRTGQFGQALLGSVGTVAMTAGAIGIEGYTLGLGTPGAITLAGGAYMSYEHTKSSINNITAPYQPQEGSRVQQSFKTPVSGSYITEKSGDIAMSSAVGIGGAKLLSSATQTLQKTVPKVKSVLFKTGKGNDVATKTTTAKLTTSPDSGSLYDSETSTRIGISAIDGKDKRVHEVLGGYGENISAKDFKLQVQAEKALDAHAKKTASGAGKSRTTSKGEVSGTGGKESREIVGSSEKASVKGETFVTSSSEVVSSPKKVTTKSSKSTGNKTINSRTEARYQPGVASGGDSLAVVREGDKWFRGTEANAAKIPKQIADQLKGREFKSFDEFRQTMWKLVAEDPVLSKNFTLGDLARMKNQGRAPKALDSQRYNGRSAYEIHHSTPINQGGDVYNIDNLVIVTPKYHNALLDPKYHGGK